MAKNNNGINSRILIAGMRMSLSILENATNRSEVISAIITLRNSIETYGFCMESIYKRLTFAYSQLRCYENEKLYEDDKSILNSMSVELNAYIEIYDKDICIEEQSEEQSAEDKIFITSLLENIKNLENASRRSTVCSILKSIMNLINTVKGTKELHNRAQFTYNKIEVYCNEKLYSDDYALLRIMIAEFREYIKLHEYAENADFKKSRYTTETTNQITVLKNEKKSTNGSNRGLAVLKIVAQILGGAVLEVLLQHFLGF